MYEFTYTYIYIYIYINYVCQPQAVGRKDGARKTLPSMAGSLLPICLFNTYH